MEHEREFQEFLDALNQHGISLNEIPCQELREQDGNRRIEFGKSVSTESGALGNLLDTFIGTELSYGSVPNAIQASDYRSSLTLSPEATISFKPYSAFRPTAVPPLEWGAVPGRYKEQVGFIERLDGAILAGEKKDDATLRTLPLRDGGTCLADGGPARLVYAMLVMRDGVKWADLLGENFPYVLATSDILDAPGRSEGGLYFVAKDLAVEPWQEKLVAFHERFCGRRGHNFALEREDELAAHLGVTDKYKPWRAACDAFAAEHGREGYFS
jgi:hypothetical protein